MKKEKLFIKKKFNAESTRRLNHLRLVLNTWYVNQEFYSSDVLPSLYSCCSFFWCKDNIINVCQKNNS